MAEPLIVRSYGRVFRVDRRIYRVDRWALPVPGGVPLRGAGYFISALLLVLVASALPVLGALVHEFSPPLRYVVLPLAVAMLGVRAAPDGRVAHRFARDWLAFRLRARRRCAGRPVALEGEVALLGGLLSTTWDAHSRGFAGRACTVPPRSASRCRSSSALAGAGSSLVLATGTHGRARS